MVTLNGKKFVRNENVYAKLAEEDKKDVVGFYKPTNCQVFLSNLAGERIGAVTCYGVLAHVSRLPDGRFWCTHATIKEIGEFPSYKAEHDHIHAVLAQMGINRRH